MISASAHPLDEFFDMGGRHFVVRIVDTFSDNVERQYAAAGNAVLQSNWSVVAQIGHTLRSSAATVGAPVVAMTFQQLEQAALDEDAARVADLLRVIHTQTLQWRQEAQAYLARSDRA